MAATPPPSSPDPRSSPSVFARVAIVVALLLAANYLIADALLPQDEEREIPYRPVFLEQVRDGNVARIRPQGESVTGRFEQPIEAPGDEGGKIERFRTEIPVFADEEELWRVLADHGVVISAEADDEGVGGAARFLFSFGPVLLLIAAFVWLVRRSAGAAGGALGALGRSRAQRVEPAMQDVSFDDVAGVDESRDELAELVDVLRAPERYRALGARVPHGVLLTGPPGTGKTLLARAVAAEAGVPFFSMSASEFVEAIVGIGAARVRDTFEQAKEAAPAIVFIDELDAIGRRRAQGAGISGQNDEREQTLNQVLAEMDGFTSQHEVIVLAATNRVDALDEALLRPGRFDRRVAVQPPDKDGRRKILEVHTRDLPLAGDVDLERVAQSTPGMVGADLANLCNEAALLAARRRAERVELRDFLEAFDKVALGTRRSIVLSDRDRELSAYHEAGHAIVAMLTAQADPVRKVSIVPRGQSLGATLAAPDSDRVSLRRAELWARMRVALGGRVAEELVFDDVSTGAEDDLEQITDIARRMVGRWAMADGGVPVTLLPRSADEMPPGAGISDHAQRRVDERAEALLRGLHEEVTALLIDHRDKLDALAAALLEHETLDEPDAYAAAGLDRDIADGPPRGNDDDRLEVEPHERSGSEHRAAADRAERL